MTVSNTTAMIGQIQICFRRNTPVRVIVRPTLVLANVMCAPPCRFPSCDARNQAMGFKFIGALPTLPGQRTRFPPTTSIIDAESSRVPLAKSLARSRLRH